MQEVVDILNQVANFVASVPGEVWGTLLGGLLVAPSAQVVKALRKIKSSAKMVMVVTVISALYSTVLFLMDSNPTNAWVIAVQSTSVYLAAQPFYFIMVKPLWGWFSARIAEAAAYRTALQSATEPAGGIPAPGDLPPAKLADVDIQGFDQ